MDYLTLPTTSKLPPIVVPYLPGFRLDDDDFDKFPARVGFASRAGIDITRPARETASLAQEWLFFGLIDALAGAPVERASFVSLDGQHIDAKPLTAIIAETTRELRSRRNLHRIEGVQKRLSDVIRASRRLDQVETDDEPSIAVFLSIKVLIDFVRTFINIGLMGGDRYSHYSSTRFAAHALQLTVLNNAVADMRQFNPVQRVLAERMRAQRWCPSHIVTVFCRTEYMMSYYLSFLARDNGITADHGSCSTSSCTAYNTNLASLPLSPTSRHVQDGCRCSMVGVPDEDVVRIVRNNEIPLVRIKTTADGGTSLQLEACATCSTLEYTAISHVWVDGMGNPERNALPACQLRKLAGYLHQQAGSEPNRPMSPPFWMDTLCIPVHKYHPETNEIAINKMALIYTGAAQVLVLDRDLENLSLEENTPDFLVASTVTSKWNTRCWTLQEGVLARKCLFQFKDAAITISMEDQAAKDRRRIFQSAIPVWEMIKDFYNDNISSAFRASGNVAEGVEGPFYGMEPAENISADILSRELIEAARFVSGQRLPLVKFFYQSAQPDDLEFLARFADTWNLLGRRQTTLPKDLHAIFANLTNVSFAQLRDVEEPVQRTKVILNSLRCFPTEILYNEYDRPLAGKDCADRWVPSHPGPEQVSGMTTLVPTPDGLLLEAKPGFQSGFTHTGIILANRGSMILSEFTVRINWHEMPDIMEVSLRCLAPENDELPRHVKQRACLSLDIHYTDPEQLKTGAAQVRGARFLILSESDPDSEGRVSVRTRFDCPVRGTIRSILDTSGGNSTDEPELPLVALHNMLPPYHEMIIEQAVDKDAQGRYLRRDRDFYAKKGHISLPMTVYDGLLLLALQIPTVPHVILQLSVGYDAVSLWLHLLAFLFTIAVGFYSQRLFMWKIDREEAAVLKIYKATFEDGWVPGEPLWLPSVMRPFAPILRYISYWAPLLSLFSSYCFLSSLAHLIVEMNG